MKKTILSYLAIVITFLAFVNNVLAQNPKIPGTHWTFDNHTMYDAILTGELFINGESMKNAVGAEYLEIGAFCGDVCYGSYLPDDVQLPFYSGYAYQMQIYSDVASGEEITFRIYDHLTETELDVECNSPIIFTANNVYGDLLNPFHLDFTMDLPESYEITVSANPAEGGSVEGGGTYIHGSSCTLTATANTGYDFINWTKDNQVVSTEASFTFTVTEDGDFIANFEEEIIPPTYYEVVVLAEPYDMGTVEGGGTYEEGETATITATPYPDCYFVNWTENGTVVSEEPEFSFTVTANRTFVAHLIVDSVVELGETMFTSYPNPVSDKLYVESQCMIEKYEIFNNIGLLVLGKTTSAKILEIDASILSSGTYIVRLTSKDGVGILKFNVSK